MKVKEKTKMALSILLCVLMLVQCVPVTALAGTGDDPCENHADFGFDHACDTCGAYVECYSEADGDHYCDLCGACFDPVDVDGDGVCDECGNTVHTPCIDENEDHFCDYSRRKLSVCIDEDGDNTCDMCGYCIEHVDADSDHLCDVCPECVSDCIDGDGDHYCDICKEWISCNDLLNDNEKCSVCGRYVASIIDMTYENLGYEMGEDGEPLASFTMVVTMKGPIEDLSAPTGEVSAMWDDEEPTTVTLDEDGKATFNFSGISVNSGCYITYGGDDTYAPYNDYISFLNNYYVSSHYSIHLSWCVNGETTTDNTDAYTVNGYHTDRLLLKQGEQVTVTVDEGIAWDYEFYVVSEEMTAVVEREGSTLTFTMPDSPVELTLNCVHDEDIDENKDHLCDFPGCDEQIFTGSDEDDDGLCDHCGSGMVSYDDGEYSDTICGVFFFREELWSIETPLTIQLLADVNMGDMADTWINFSDETTLELDGHSITGDYVMSNYDNMTITGGSIISGTDCAVVNYGGTLTISGNATVSGDKYTFCYVSGTIDLSGASIPKGGWTVYNDSEDNTMTIGEDLLLPDDCIVTVDGTEVDELAPGEAGTIKHSHNYNTGNYGSDGTYHWPLCSCGDPGENVVHIANANANGKCEICGAAIAASVKINGNTTYYTDLQAAIDAAENGTEDAPATVTLQADYSGDDINITGSFMTLDLNGHSITGTTYGVYNGGGTVEITGGSISGTDYGVFNSGTVTISDCTISGDKYTFCYASGTIDLSGASIPEGGWTVYNDSEDNTMTIGENLLLSDDGIVTVDGKKVTALASYTTGTIIEHSHTGEHTYGDWKVVKEPTKTVKGEKQRACSVCGHVDSEEIPVLSDNPATGDDSNIVLYGSMFTVSLATLIVLLLTSKKRKQEEA